VSIDRIDVFLFRHHRILLVLVITIVAALSIYLPLYTFNQYRGDLRSEVNPTVVNGILTATAIVFGFVAFELREIKSSSLERFLLSLPLLLYMMTTLEYYFIEAVVGKITTELVLEATSNCLFNILYSLPLALARFTREEIERKKN